MRPGRRRRRSRPARARRAGRRREQQPQQRRVGADQLDQRGADDEAGDRAEQAARARSAPVLSAFERSTESVPSTTQKACCTPVRLAISTARPRPMAPRMLFCSHSEWCSTWAPARSWAAESGSGEARGLAAEQLVDPAAPLGRGGPVDVRRDLRHDEAQLLCPEGGVERGDHVAHRRLCRGLSARRGADRQPQVVALELAQSRAQLRQRRVQIVRGLLRRVQQVGTAFEHRGGSGLDRADARVDRGRVRVRRCPQDDRVEPACSSSTSRTTVRAAVLSPVGR